MAKFKLTLAHLEVLRRAPLGIEEPATTAANEAIHWKLLRWDAGARSDGDGGWIQVKEIPAASDSRPRALLPFRPTSSADNPHTTTTDRPWQIHNGQDMKLDDKFDDKVANTACAGHIAFDAYCDSVAGVAHTGRAIPDWADLPEHIRLAWVVCVQAAIADELANGRLVRPASPVVEVANRG